MEDHMAHMFPSEEWLAAWVDEINASEAYRKAASTWEGDFYFLVEPGAGLSERVIMHIDLWHGEARSASVVSQESDMDPEFVIRAPIGTWRRVIEKRLDPIQGMITGQLKLKGTLSKIMRAPKAAAELVNCATRVSTEFPG
jgi:putative sterol carrier protein